MKVTERRVVLECAKPGRSAWKVFAKRLEPDPKANWWFEAGITVSLSDTAWHELGSPTEITVTVAPGGPLQ